VEPENLGNNFHQFSEQGLDIQNLILNLGLACPESLWNVLMNMLICLKYVEVSMSCRNLAIMLSVVVLIVMAPSNLCIKHNSIFY
jgi:hypothetical protein